MKFCHKCGAQCGDNEKFCKQCGAELTQANETQNAGEQYSNVQNEGSQYYGAPQNNYNNQQYGYGGPQNTYGGPSGQPGEYANPVVQGIERRNIAVAVILSIVTCGIYSIYWMIKINDEVNQLSGDYEATTGGMVFLFTLITCGIYGLYWLYKMGERCDIIKRTNGSSGILYLLLGIFGFSIISYCLIQDTINKAV